MKPMNDRTKLGQPRPAAAPTPRNRFRIQKLEERIAPRKGGNGTKNCTDFVCNTNGTRCWS